MLDTDPRGQIGGPLGSRVRGGWFAAVAVEPPRGTRSRRLDYCLLALAVRCVRVLRLGGSRSGNGIHCAGQTPRAGRDRKSNQTKPKGGFGDGERIPERRISVRHYRW